MIAASLLFVVAPVVQEDGAAVPPRLTPAALVEEAWRFLPAYDGTHREFLSEGLRRDVVAGAKLLEAAVELEPTHTRGWWSLGHARVLLAEDSKNRERTEEGRAHYRAALDALGHAIELDPDDPWALYARGAVRVGFSDFDEAIDDLTRAVQAAQAEIDGGTPGSAPWLRFKALEWRAEALMRQGDHDRAREELTAFHEEFSNNAWPLYIALAENALRAREFDEAREHYLKTFDEFATDHQAYALLAYLAGLRGDRERATSRLTEALDRELQPGIYTRLWLVILATDDARAAAEEDLRGFLEHPPSEIPEWDLFLGRFVLGQGTPEAFLARALEEEQRRMDAGEILDDLQCEALFYAGLRREHDAVRESDPVRRDALLVSALDSYRMSLRFRPPAWKWEWAYARLHFADLAKRLDRGASGAIVLTEHSPQELDSGATPIRAVWHAPRAGSPAPALGREPEPGDLFLARIRQDGRVVPARMVVDARSE